MKRGRKEPEVIREQKALHECGHCPSRISGTRGATLNEDQPRDAGWKMEPDGLKGKIMLGIWSMDKKPLAHIAQSGGISVFMSLQAQVS